MPKNLLDSLPEIFVSTSAQTGMVSRLSKKGQLRKIAPKVYTKNLREAPEAVVRRNLWPLVCKLVPGALIADRTAIEMAPAIDGSIFVIAERKRDISLPGITIKSRKGHELCIVLSVNSICRLSAGRGAQARSAGDPCPAGGAMVGLTP